MKINSEISSQKLNKIQKATTVIVIFMILLLVINFAIMFFIPGYYNWISSKPTGIIKIIDTVLPGSGVYYNESNLFVFIKIFVYIIFGAGAWFLISMIANTELKIIIKKRHF
jgi:hypothetical protein